MEFRGGIEERKLSMILKFQGQMSMKKRSGISKGAQEKLMWNFNWS